MIGLIIYLLVIGVIAGYLARLLVPGPDPMGFWQTAALGIVGSFVGGLLGYVLFGHDLDEGALQASGVIGSIILKEAILTYSRANEYGHNLVSKEHSRPGQPQAIAIINQQPMVYERLQVP